MSIHCISAKFHMNINWVNLNLIHSRNSVLLKNMGFVGGASQYDIQQNFWNCSFDFNQISLDCFLDEPLSNSFKKCQTIDKHGCLICLYGIQWNLQNLLLLNCPIDFNLISHECSFYEPLSDSFHKFLSFGKHITFFSRPSLVILASEVTYALMGL